MVDINATVAALTKIPNYVDGFKIYGEDIKKAINGILAHEVLVGDIKYIPTWAKIVMPFDYFTQVIVSHKLGATIEEAKLLALARMFALAWWSTHLNGVDKTECIIYDPIVNKIAVDETKTPIAMKIEDWAGINPLISNGPMSIDIPKLKAMSEDPSSVIIKPGVNAQNFQLLMFNAVLAISMNLVKTGHHYQDNANGTFKSLEKKIFGMEMFQRDERTIIYHHVIHPFSQLGKKSIYTSVKNSPNQYTTIDPLLLKRIPVVPQNSAWLAAGVAIMEEIQSVPKLAVALPAQYADVVTDARAAIEKAKEQISIVNLPIKQFEPMACFAYGVLRQVAPTHSAIKAISLSKLSEQHIGATAAGETFAKDVL